MKYLFILMFIVSGCSRLDLIKTTPEDEEYLRTIKFYPTSISVSFTESQIAWGRAQAFVGKYSSMKLQTATDYIIQTYNPTSSRTLYGYMITKTPIDSSFEISVDCIPGNSFTYNVAERNAKICSYYIKTGIIRPHLLN